MFRMLMMSTLITGAIAVTAIDQAQADQNVTIQADGPLVNPGQAASDEIVRYQLSDWKAKHIHDTKKADTIAKTLKKLGCETKTHEHNGHIDVRYRCPKWRQLELETHADAHKWEKWLKEFGFKTEHKH